MLTHMATKKTAKKSTAKKTVRKRPQGKKVAPGSGKREEREQEVQEAAGPEAAAAAKKTTGRKFSKKKLERMVDKMLLQLADQVEEGGCKITTSEGMKLIQLRESLGIDRPSSVKVEWVEPKEP